MRHAIDEEMSNVPLWIFFENQFFGPIYFLKNQWRHFDIFAAGRSTGKVESNGQSTIRVGRYMSKTHSTEVGNPAQFCVNEAGCPILPAKVSSSFRITGHR